MVLVVAQRRFPASAGWYSIAVEIADAMMKREDVPNGAIPGVIDDVLESLSTSVTTVGEETYAPPRRLSAIL